MGMRINLGKCDSFEEYRLNLRALDEAIANKEIGVKFYKGAVETAPRSSGLKERVSLLTAHWQFRANNTLFIKFMGLSVKIIVQGKELSKEDKQSLIRKLKATPGSISIVSRDGKTIKAPVAVLPEFFSAAGRRPTVYGARARLEGKPFSLDFEVPLDSYKDRSVYLDFDSDVINLFLDYECCVPINKEISLYQLLQLHRLADYLQLESLYYTTLGLLNCQANAENHEFILPEILSAILTKPVEKVAHVTNIFYKKINRSSVEIQIKLFKQARSAAYTSDVGLYHMGIFCIQGWGTTCCPERAMEYFKFIASTYYPAQFCLEKFANQSYFSFPEDPYADSVLQAHPVKEDLVATNRNIAQKPAASLQESLRRLRESQEELATIEFEAGLSDETVQIPRSFVPFDAIKIEGANAETTVKLFIDFQYGLGIPEDAPFESLIVLYSLAYSYEIKDLLKATRDLIGKSFAIHRADELLPQLFDPVLFDEKVPLFEASVVLVFLGHLVKAQKITQEAFVKKLELLVIQQNGVAQNLLGFCLMHGCGVEKNEEKALEHYESAAGKKIALALYNLGSKRKDPAIRSIEIHSAADRGLSIAELWVGIRFLDGVFANPPLGFAYLQKAANQGNALAQYHVGLCYHKGKGVDKDSEKALAFFNLSADQKEPRAFHGLGLCATDPTVASVWYFIGAEKGDLECLNSLAGCYMRGEGVQKCEKQGIRYYRMASIKGHLRSKFDIALCYQNGTGMKKNLVIALEILEELADEGFVDAQCMAGKYYAEGLAGDKEPVLAFEYYKKAADQGNNAAQQRVGMYYEDGIGVDKSLQLACKYYEMIPQNALKDFPQAANFLAKCYKTGFTRYEGAARLLADPEKAFKYFKYAAVGTRRYGNAY